MPVQVMSRKVGHLIETTILVPFRRWQRVRERLHRFIWPTDEEAREYRRILRNLEREDWLRRVETNATRVKRRGKPPHHACPCKLCGRYWQGYWTQP